MTLALMFFSLSIFCLILVLQTWIKRWWDKRAEAAHVLRHHINALDQDSAPLARPAPPIRSQSRDKTGWGRLSHFWQRWQQQRRLGRLEEQLPDALDYFNRALRAGHDLSRAIQLAGTELQEPLATELRMVSEEISYGGGLSVALQHFSQRFPSVDIRTLAVAGSLHRETGGDITRVFERLARVVRERAALREQIRVLSAEGRLSAWVLSLLPLGCGALVQGLHPGLMGLLLTDSYGRWALMGAAILWVSGIVLMRHMIRIEL